MTKELRIRHIRSIYASVFIGCVLLCAAVVLCLASVSLTRVSRTSGISQSAPRMPALVEGVRPVVRIVQTYTSKIGVAQAKRPTYRYRSHTTYYHHSSSSSSGAPLPAWAWILLISFLVICIIVGVWKRSQRDDDDNSYESNYYYPHNRTIDSTSSRGGIDRGRIWEND